VAECLRRLGVYPEKSIDDEGRERFHSMSILTNLKGDFPEWYRRYAANPLKTVICFCLNLNNLLTNIMHNFRELSVVVNHLFHFIILILWKWINYIKCGMSLKKLEKILLIVYLICFFSFYD
jgi:hypothetical protein